MDVPASDDKSIISPFWQVSDNIDDDDDDHKEWKDVKVFLHFQLKTYDRIFVLVSFTWSLPICQLASMVTMILKFMTMTILWKISNFADVTLSDTSWQPKSPKKTFSSTI